MELKFDLTTLKRYRPFLPYLGVVLIILLTFSLLTTSFNKINSLKETNASLEQENKNLAKNLAELKSFVAEGLEAKIELALKALPRTKDPVFILSSAKLLIMESGLTAEEISFSPGKITKEEVKGAKNVEEVKVAIKAKGTLDQAQAFLKHIYQVLPIVSLESASFDFSADKGNIFNAVLTFHFSPVESGKIGEQVILPTAGEEKIYEEIAKLEVLGSGELAAEEGVLETFDPNRDPFAPSFQEEPLSQEAGGLEVLPQ